MKEYVRAKRIVLAICWGLIIPALVVAVMWRLGTFDQEADQLSAIDPVVEIAKEEVVTEEVIAEEVVAEEVIAEEVVAEEVIAEEVIAEEVVTEEVVTEEVVTEEVVAEEVIAEEVVTEERPLTQAEATPPTENIEPTLDESGNLEQTVVEPTASTTTDTPVNGQISADGTMTYAIGFGWIPYNPTSTNSTIQLDTTLSGELVGY